MNLTPFALLSLLACCLCWLAMSSLAARPDREPPGRTIRSLWGLSLLCLALFLAFLPALPEP